MKEKKEYYSPSIEVVIFNCNDVITASTNDPSLIFPWDEEDK